MGREGRREGEIEGEGGRGRGRGRGRERGRGRDLMIEPLDIFFSIFRIRSFYQEFVGRMLRLFIA